MKKDHIIARKYRSFIEKLYEESDFYRNLVFLSKIIKMILYVVTGASIIAVVFFGLPPTSFENLMLWMSQTLWGKLVALLIGLSLIVYGLEKPRK